MVVIAVGGHLPELLPVLFIDGRIAIRPRPLRVWLKMPTIPVRDAKQYRQDRQIHDTAPDLQITVPVIIRHKNGLHALQYKAGGHNDVGHQIAVIEQMQDQTDHHQKQPHLPECRSIKDLLHALFHGQDMKGIPEADDAVQHTEGAQYDPQVCDDYDGLFLGKIKGHDIAQAFVHTPALPGHHTGGAKAGEQ